jgi:hypothetical protein
MEVRACSSCNETKPAEAFTRRRTHRPGKLVSECTPCKVNRNQRYRIKNRERVLEIERKSKFKQQYGISLEDYARMLGAQNGGCAICAATEPSSRTTYFAVDHCHATGVVRGLLCTKCNRGLGLFNDDTDRMGRAVKYLKGDLFCL